MNIETLELSRLNPAPYNPRRISDDAMKRLEKSIAEWGLVDPLIWNRQTGNLVGGHQRLKVLQKQGATTADCVVVDLPLSREKALNVALNNQKMAGEYDFALLADLLQEIDTGEFSVSDLTGFSEGDLEEIAAWTPTDDREETEPVPEPPAEAVSKLGDLWEMGAHRLLCGDSTKAEDIRLLMDGSRASCVFTDPPYGVGYTGKGGASIEGDITETAVPLFFSFLDQMLGENGWLYVCAGYSQLSTIERLFVRYLRCVPRPIVWDKCRTVMRHNGYHSAYEAIYVGYREGAGAFWNGPRDGEAATDVWRVRLEENREHLTQKPVELPIRAFRNSSKHGDIVLDPFLGSGTTIIAAEKLGRRCYAIEIEPRYIDVAVKRWQNVTGKRAKNLTRPGVEIA